MSERLSLKVTYWIALGALAAAPVRPAAAQEAGLDPALLRESQDTVAVTVEVPGRTIPFATAIESLRRTVRGGRPVWEQAYEWKGNDGSQSADTLWFNAATLRPVENHLHNESYDAVTVYSGNTARTRQTPKGGAEQASDTTVAGPLFASGEFAALIRASPLADGYTASYELYYGPPRAVRTGPFRVVGSETVRTRAGAEVDCWVVDAPLSEGLNTFYVSKSDRTIVRLVNHEDPRAAFVFTR